MGEFVDFICCRFRQIGLETLLPKWRKGYIYQFFKMTKKCANSCNDLVN